MSERVLGIDHPNTITEYVSLFFYLKTDVFVTCMKTFVQRTKTLSIQMQT